MCNSVLIGHKPASEIKKRTSVFAKAHSFLKSFIQRFVFMIIISNCEHNF